MGLSALLLSVSYGFQVVLSLPYSYKYVYELNIIFCDRIVYVVNMQSFKLIIVVVKYGAVIWNSPRSHSNLHLHRRIGNNLKTFFFTKLP